MPRSCSRQKFRTLNIVEMASLVLVDKSLTSKKKFSVVLFPKDNTYAVVPSTWMLEDRTQCYWPGRKTKNPATLSADEFSKPDPTFDLHDAEFIKSYGNYKKAQEKAAILKNSITAEIPESSDTDIEGRRNKSNPIPEVDATAPTTSVHVELDSRNLTTNEDTYVQFGSSIGNLDSSVNECEDTPHQSQSFQFVLDPNTEALKQQFEAFQELCLTGIESVRQEVKDVKDLLRRVLAGFEANSNSTPPEHKYPSLPLRSETEFIEAELAITDRTQYNALVAEFMRIGGSNPTKNTYNILRHALSHDLALKLRYTDKSGKTALGGTRLAQAIRDAVCSSPHEIRPQESAVNDWMAKWLRNSIDRQGGTGAKKQNGDSKKNSKSANSGSCSSISQQDQIEPNEPSIPSQSSDQE